MGGIFQDAIIDILMKGLREYLNNADRSTLDILLRFISNATKILNNRHQLLDIKCDCDKIKHVELLYKLLASQISTGLVRIINSYILS